MRVIFLTTFVTNLQSFWLIFPRLLKKIELNHTFDNFIFSQISKAFRPVRQIFPFLS